jgi:hypothetical protein
VNLDADIQTRIESLLASAKAPIDAYRTFLDKVLVNPDIDKDSLKFKPAGKLREILGDNHRKLETLQRELASIKGSLSAALSLANLYGLLQYITSSAN